MFQPGPRGYASTASWRKRLDVEEARAGSARSPLAQVPCQVVDYRVSPMDTSMHAVQVFGEMKRRGFSTSWPSIGTPGVEPGDASRQLMTAGASALAPAQMV